MDRGKLEYVLSAPAVDAAEARGHPRPALLLEVGPGWAEEYRLDNPKVVDFLDQGFGAAKAAGARVVCYLTLAPRDNLKPPQFVSTQGLEPTRKMNAWVAQLCRERGGVVLDAFALSEGTFSRDGTHYQSLQMSVVAQALLNLLAHFE
jgi:hypothetical protein